MDRINRRKALGKGLLLVAAGLGAGAVSRMARTLRMSGLQADEVMTVSAAGATFTVTTPLGTGVAIRSLTADERLSGPFRFLLELEVPDMHRDVFPGLLGQELTVALAPASDRARSGTAKVIVQDFIFVRPTHNCEAMVIVVPLMVDPQGKHRHLVLTRAGGDKIIRCVAGRLTWCVREWDVLQDILRNRTQSSCRNHVTSEQLPKASGIHA